MDIRISCGINSPLDGPEHARIAEQLGYHTVWFYDSPALYSDVWVQLCRAAEITDRVRLGPGVLVPTLRHPMVTASAIATLAGIASRDRVVVGIGTGFTGAFTLGLKPATWNYVSDYIRTLRALLRGEQTEWQGAHLRMLHYPGFAPSRPIEVPIVVGAAGPKGLAVARALGDGVLSFSPQPPSGFDWNTCLMFGTVLDDGEDPGSERAIQAAGAGAGMWMHWMVEHGELDQLPNGEQWLAAYADIPADSRHLELHDGHMIAVNKRDRPFVTGDLLTQAELALSPSAMRDRIQRLRDSGATEIVYSPLGPDIGRELESFAKAVQA